MSSTNPLLGRWHGTMNGQQVAMEFLEDGRLVYVILVAGGSRTLNMTYRVDGDHIVTNQPSAPREERTRFSLDAAGALNLEFGGTSTRWTR